MIELNFKKGEEWYLEERFEKIKEFRETGTYSMAKTVDSDGIIGIHIEEYDFEKPQEFQKKALEYFNNNQTDVLNALCLGIIEYYPKLMKVYDITEFDEEFGFPKIQNIDDVKKVIGIGNIHILDDKKDELSYVGFECGCPWDEEHGLGIIMHKERVIDVGAADIAFSGSKELRKDNGTYTEEERLEDEKWEKQIAENIAKYKKEQEETKLREVENKKRKLNKKWWQFWTK
ncbi:hypothetical protein [Aquimarina sp. MMG016]|uniref:DUF6985 domain-containing protein n=1 Tax=Aquimarina sp. MMG016 TaxID=2822690 RepID=UPI001B3A396F|nr:hypothetical protein [Aquimarina sp. MMG016]MBQ4822109.1 hypothetical protein [Aquimarina sp. MMG016]